MERLETDSQIDYEVPLPEDDENAYFDASDVVYDAEERSFGAAEEHSRVPGMRNPVTRVTASNGSSTSGERRAMGVRDAGARAPFGAIPTFPDSNASPVTSPDSYAIPIPTTMAERRAMPLRLEEPTRRNWQQELSERRTY